MWGVLDDAVTDHENPHLVELAAHIKRGRKVARTVAWSSLRIVGTVAGGRVTLERRYGPVTGEFSVARDDLESILAAARDWVRLRDDWSCFYGSSAGYPAHMGAWYWQKPGKNGERVTLGVSNRPKESRDFTGTEERRPLKEPRKLRRGVVATHELWRVGEIVGDPKGERVGLVYALPKKLTVVARRDKLELVRGGAKLFLEDDETPFVEELCSYLRMNR